MRRFRLPWSMAIGALLVFSAVASAQPTDSRDQPKVPPPADTARPTPKTSEPPATADTAPGTASVKAPAPAPDTSSGRRSRPVVSEVVSGENAYQLRLRGLEERVNELKEKIFRSKARLVRLQETVLSGSVSGAYAVLYHTNRMGSAFRLVEATYHLDGAPIYQPADAKELERKRDFPIFNGAIVPGSHTITVRLVYQGSSSVFPYWRGYRFRIKSSFTHHFEEGKITSIKVIGFEKGGVTVELKDRPSVRFDIDVKKMNRNAAASIPGPEGKTR